MPISQPGDNATFNVGGSYNDVARDQYNYHYHYEMTNPSAKFQKIIGDVSNILAPRLAKSFTYMEQSKTPCSPYTRAHILRKLFGWSRDTHESSRRFFWLTGVPGSGKSSITTSLAASLRDEKTLVAQLFISRSYSSTTDPNCIFPSIALQLAKQHPDVAYLILKCLQDKPSLLDRISDEQVTELFIKPIQILAQLLPSQSIVIVIDALDEIDPLHVTSMAKIISKAVHSLPEGTKVFVSSRPENGIQVLFSPLVREQKAAHLDLEPSHPSSIQDVSLFLAHGISEIATEYGLLEDWPGEERLSSLGQAASGLFVWAATAIKFIRSRVEMDGSECLDDVLDDLKSQGMDDIDTLYDSILQRMHSGPRVDKWDFEKFRRIIGAIISLKEPLPLVELKSLLHLHNPKGRPVDVKHFVRRFRTVLVVGNDDITDESVPRLHKSFVDFITDTCDERFRVNGVATAEELAVRCLRLLLGLLSRDMCKIERLGKFNSEITDLDSRIERYLSLSIRYSCRFWACHLVEAKSASTEDLASLCYQFFFQKLVHWLEVMSMLDYTSIFSLLSQAAEWEKFGGNGNENLRSIINDSARFVQMFSEVIAQSSAMISISAIPFTPHTSILYRTYQTTCISSIEVLAGALDYWPPQVWQAKSTKSHGVTLVAFSPDGTRIASICDSEHTICLWDAASGQLVGSPLSGHLSGVTCVAFSPNGKTVASGSNDSTIRIWDVHSASPIGLPLVSHSDAVRSVAFSPNGKQILSGSQDCTIRLWDVTSGSLVVTLEGHSETVVSVAFLLDGTKMVSGSSDGDLNIWDIATLQPVGMSIGYQPDLWSLAISPDEKLIASAYAAPECYPVCLWDVVSGENVGTLEWVGLKITSIAFSPNGTTLVGASENHAIYIWNVANTQIVASFHGHHNTVTSVAFSPDGTHIVSGAFDHTIRVWNVTSSQDEELSCEGHIAEINSVAFSPNGNRIVSGAYDSKVCIWDAADGALIGTPLEGHTQWVEAVRLSPDGKSIASGSQDNTVCIWNASSGELMTKYEAHVLPVTSVAFSPDGKTIASVSRQEHMLCIYDVQSGRRFSLTKIHSDSWITALTYSSDGNAIVLGFMDGMIHLWDIASGQYIGVPLKCHNIWVASVTLSPDGRQIISRDKSEVTCFWDAVDRRRIPPERWHLEMNSFVPILTDGWVRNSQDGRLLFYIPPRNRGNTQLDSWAYLGAKIAIGSRLGVMTIIDIAPVLQNLGISI